MGIYSLFWAWLVCFAYKDITSVSVFHLDSLIELGGDTL